MKAYSLSDKEAKLMSFSQKYEELERKFCEQVQKDFDCRGLESGMLRNIQPNGPADFILIAQEPAWGGQKKTGKRPPDWEFVKDRENRNFCGHIYDFMFHFCIRNYLCEDGQTYYLTDLSKGAMSVKQAAATSRETYKRWYPLLVEELNLVAKLEGTRVIAIGEKVHTFLRKRKEFECIDKIIHYSRAANGARAREVEQYVNGFPEFADTLKFSDILDTTEEVMKRAGYSNSSREEKCQRFRSSKSRLTTARKKSIFYYKKRFEELKVSKGLIWRGES